MSSSFIAHRLRPLASLIAQQQNSGVGLPRYAAARPRDTSAFSSCRSSVVNFTRYFLTDIPITPQPNSVYPMFGRILLQAVISKMLDYQGMFTLTQ